MGLYDNLGGIGTYTGYNNGYGDADAWGGPDNGVDLLQHIGTDVTPKSYKLSSDVYMFIMVIGALAILWFLGGIVFRNARL